jgi:hypothetical protein
MGTFGNLRPCSFAAPSLVDISPLKADVCRGVDFNIIRELTGGIYFGDRKEDNGDGFAMDTEPYSRAEIERITRLAAHLALQHDPPLPVWSLDKANVLATSRLWRKVVTEVITNEFPQLKLGHHLIDSAAMLMIKDPRKLNGIVVTSNLFGDIISDEASVIPGSLGLLPSASLTGVPDGKSKVNGIYEPIHGMTSSQLLELELLCTNEDKDLPPISPERESSTLSPPSCQWQCCFNTPSSGPLRHALLKKQYETSPRLVSEQAILAESRLLLRSVMLSLLSWRSCFNRLIQHYAGVMLLCCYESYTRL